MLLSIQQKYILETLRKLGCVRRRQLRALLRGRFGEANGLDRRMDAMLRQLRMGCGGFRTDEKYVWLDKAQPNHRRLEAVDVMLELSEGCPQEFTAKCRLPELLRFSWSGTRLQLFAVADLSGSLTWTMPDQNGIVRTVWISDSGTAPKGLVLPPKHFFAARQPDGSHRFYGS